MKRTFIAAKIKAENELVNIYTKLRNELENEKIKWVDHHNFHLTLFFLGDTTEDQIKEVRVQMSNIVDNFESFTMKIQGLGVFKNFHKPRVLWAGIQNYNPLAEIKKQVDKEKPTYYVRCLFADPAFNPFDPLHGFSDQGTPFE